MTIRRISAEAIAASKTSARHENDFMVATVLSAKSHSEWRLDLRAELIFRDSIPLFKSFKLTLDQSAPSLDSLITGLLG
jgi:hypothetical protein